LFRYPEGEPLLGDPDPNPYQEKINKSTNTYCPGDNNSVADPGCLQRIPNSDFFPFRIPDPTTEKRRQKIN
jgi:hypothetical protein